jgi:hypothetical protein
MAKEVFGAVNTPLSFIPGNHDIGDKPANWMPGPKVSIEGIELFEKHWGKSYSSFDHREVHFILLNSPVLNSGLPTEKEQRTWLEADLAKHKGRRIFVFTHYPLFIENAQEAEHYDNIREPARSWLLSLLKEYNVECVYAGHVHNFFYNTYENVEQYVLPSVTFFRPDYSELFHIEPVPEAEGARNDTTKLGFFLVKVYKDKHANHLIRTQGKTEEAPLAPKIRSFHTKENDQNPMGMYLRHGWADLISIPHANLDEFGRKVVRNDYTLLSLWDLGIQKLRVPFNDLLSDSTRERMKALKRIGHEFTVFSVGIPDDRMKSALIHHSGLVDVWEIAMAADEFTEIIPHVLEVKKETLIRTRVAEILTSATTKNGTHFVHFIKHGFTSDQRNEIARYFEAKDARKAFDGVVFRLDHKSPALEEMNSITRLAEELRIAAAVHAQMQGSDNAAFAYREDREIANRVAEITVAAGMHPNIETFFDTFLDHDRGYFRRNGFLDRSYNPRPAFHVLKYLSGFLMNQRNYTIKRSGDSALWLESPERTSLLILPKQSRELSRGPVAIPHELEPGNTKRGRADCIHLGTGELGCADWTAEPSDHEFQIRWEPPVDEAGPVLIVFKHNFEGVEQV